MKNNKKLVTERLVDITSTLLSDRLLVNVANDIAELQRTHKQHHANLRIVDIGSWSDSEIWLYGDRPETKMERSVRVARNAKAKAATDKRKATIRQKDMKEMKRLAKKHGVKIIK